jgi:hypothetical protein
MTLLLALGFYALGAISMGLFMALMMAWHYARRPKPPTLHHRKHRDAAERRLSREIQAGMAELNERDGEDRVRYEFLGQTGFEE